MSSAQQNLVDRTRYVFATPSWHVVVIASLVVSVIAGIVGVGPTIRGLTSGLLVVGVPAVVGTVLTPILVDRPAVDTRRSGFLAFVGAVITTAFVIGVATTQYFLGVGAVAEAVLVAAAGVFAFRLLVLFSVAGPPLKSAVVPASVQSVVTALAVAAAYPSLVTLSTAGVVLIVTALYAGVVLGLVAIVEYPLRREWGVSGFEFVHQFLEYVAGRPTTLEAYFAELGQRVTVPVTVLSLRPPGGDEKARVVVTHAHPGPLPDLGGGTLPRRLADGGNGLVFVPHGFSDHDYNPTGQDGVDALCAAADRATATVTEEPAASKPVVRRVDDVTVTAQSVGDGALFLSTFAPDATDDVHHSVGEAAASRAVDAGIRNPLVIDAHNCRPIGGVEDGHVSGDSPRAETLERAIETVAADLVEEETGPLRAGVAADATPWNPTEGFGSLGVRALAIEVADTTVVYVLVDGNNMIPGLRDRVREAVDGADVVEVATTDTHEVNRMTSTNYVGAAVDADAVVDRLVAVGEAALSDMEPVVAGTATEDASITVFGTETVDRLARLTDRILPVSRAFVVVSVALVTTIAAGLFWLV